MIMKKVLFAIVLTVFIVSGTYSQEDGTARVSSEIPEWRFGLKAQPSISWLRTPMKEFENGKTKLNFGYGLMVEKSLFKSTVLATGLLVNDFGGNYSYVGLDHNINFKEQNDSILFTSRKLYLKYVEIPFALKFRTPEINYFTYFAHFGLDLGFRVKATADDNFRDIRTNKTGLYEAEVINNDAGFMRMGLNVGLGGEYSIAGTTSIMVGLAYVNGFTNVMRKESEMLLNASNDARMKQIFYGHSVVLNLGILF